MRKGSCRWVGIALAVAVVCGFSAPAFAQDAAYIGEAKCKTCHNKKDEGEQWNKWKAEKHPNALAALSTPKAAEIAKAKGIAKPPAEAPECLKCHVTAFDAASGKAPEAIVPASGVQCEACHGPGSLHQEEGKKKLFKKDATAKTAETITKPDAKTCEKCHNKDNPTFNPERYTLKDGSKADFDFEQAYAKIAHPNPKKAAAK
ncbi:MAG: hypothetical protein FJY92_04875 [Candidatus Hydrogenedentes bacterium]|nr:hypothetical protein [Candidatus Hydrogenedentota bacterium]